MRARDDYPQAHWHGPEVEAMYDEIERLRRALDLSVGIGLHDVEMPESVAEKSTEPPEVHHRR